MTEPNPACCQGPQDCSDGDPCTQDQCDTTTGACSNIPFADCCEKASDCNDGNQCTADVCVVDLGICAHAAIPGCCVSNQGCDDGDPCTSDVCDALTGTCSNGFVPGCCTDDAECASTEPCVKGQCIASQCELIYDPECCTSAAQCNDSNPCTQDVCVGGQCAHGPTGEKGCCTVDADCNDGNVCTFDVCAVDNGCENPPKPPLQGVPEICGDGVDNDCNPETVCYVVKHGGQTSPLVPIEGTKSVVAFYSYKFVHDFTADTGYEVEDECSVMLYRDDAGNVSLVWINDEVDEEENVADGGQMNLKISGAFDMDLLVYDDIPEPSVGNDSYNVNPVTGEGSIQWYWNTCCTDGMALGYMKGEMCISLKPTAVAGINGIRVWDSPQHNIPLGKNTPFEICGVQ